jgi:hypothetical protein
VRFDDVRPAADDPALLYSLAELADVIFTAFEVAGVRSVVEIGAEAGDFTRLLLDWTDGRGGRLVSVDPAPSDAVRAMAASAPRMTLVEDISHRALDGLEGCDAYLLDGDHNYATVRGELDRIVTATERDGVSPLVVLQDVGWPSGRRDQYYAPDRLPADDVHPYDFGGVLPWVSHTVPGGFRGEAQFAFATEEGGPRNGVLTGLEDFLAVSDGWSTIAIPAVFGLALVYRADAPWAANMAAALGPLDDHPLLARLEANRVHLYLRLVAVQDELRRAGLVAAERVTALEGELDSLRATLAVAEQARRSAEAVADAALRRAATPPPPPPARPTLLQSARSVLKSR